MKIRLPGRILMKMLTTLVSKPATNTNPYDATNIPSKYRGRIVYDSSTCIGCGICMRDCPTKSLRVENIGTKENKKFIMHYSLGRCIFCCQCVDSCPKKSLSQTRDFLLATTDSSDLEEIMR
ncbi:MAG TPA: 4Fe-4S binding protein [Clostridiales bacterium]|nr:4Fe-4S binding protein [Clostridiales bacterium]